MLGRLLQFITRRDGAIAVEFAFVAPVMIGMFFGLTELALALGVHADVINLSSVGSDLVAQESTITTSDMTNVFSALSAMLYPYSTTPAQITISSVIDNNTATSGKVACAVVKAHPAHRIKYNSFDFINDISRQNDRFDTLSLSIRGEWKSTSHAVHTIFRI